MIDKYFTKDFLLNLPPDSTDAILALAKEFMRMMRGIPNVSRVSNHNNFVEAVAIISGFCKSRNINLDVWPKVTSDRGDNVEIILDWAVKLHDSYMGKVTNRDTSTIMTETVDEYAAFFSNLPHYEFNDKDLSRIQILINELRGLISTNKLLTPDHIRRLLRRLEAMQAELHKGTSDIDRFWGFFAEAIIATRKFGEDLNPISERVQEIGKIVIAVVMAKEGIKALPDITHLLTGK